MIDLGRAGWYSGNSGDRNLSAIKLDLETLEASHCRTHPIGQKAPNGWGLYDMHGNVYEWCNDWYGIYKTGNYTDPTGTHKGSIRLIRGGSWGSYGNRCTSVGRNGYTTDSRYSVLGFRVVRCAP